MRRGFHSGFPIGLALLILLVLPAGAIASPVVIEDQVPPGDELFSATGLCVLEHGPFAAFAGTYEPEVLTSAATLVRPSSCAACPSPGILMLNSVSFRVLWSGVVCNPTVEITVVESSGGACPTPLADQVICGPITHSISGTSGRVVYTLPMPTPCCLSRDAFVLVKFIGLDQCANPVSGAHPAFYFASSSPACAPCTQYATVSNTYPTPTEWCTIWGGFANLWLSVDADCCDPTPTLPSSWGRLKTVYQ